MMTNLEIARLRLAIELLKQDNWDNRAVTEAWTQLIIMVRAHHDNKFLAVAIDSLSGPDCDVDIKLAIEALALITGDTVAPIPEMPAASEARVTRMKPKKLFRKPGEKYIV